MKNSRDGAHGDISKEYPFPDDSPVRKNGVPSVEGFPALLGVNEQEPTGNA
jgi:hypothetical protein